VKSSVFCSRCSNKERLNLVTVRYDEQTKSGRILVFCEDCVKLFSREILVNIPLPSVSFDTFIELYRAKKTKSDPYTAAEIVFGSAIPKLAREADSFRN